LIVLNKVDRFQDIRDFARTYGALCWNLSKAIPRKDLPHIYNVYVPVAESDAPATPGLPLLAFDRARDEVVEEIKRAPARRLDNIVSRLYDHARRLRVHAIVCDQARRELDRARFRLLAIAVAAAFLTVSLAWFTREMFADLPVKVTVITLAVGFVLTLAVVLVRQVETEHRSQDILDGLDGVFERSFERELVLGDRSDDLRSLWKTVKDRTQKALQTLEVRKIPRLRRGEVKRMDALIQGQIPALRNSATR
jgi:hypothetical protein